MTVTNNTSKLITLLNEKKIKPHDTIIINNPEEELLKQIENLINMGQVSTGF